MQDFHILDFHDDILGRYWLSQQVLPFLKEHGYRTIGLEGFIFGDSLEAFKFSLKNEIEETREMLETLGMGSISILCSFGLSGFSPTFDLKEIIIAELLSIIDRKKELNITVEHIKNLMDYIESSLINRSTLHLVEQLELLEFEIIPIENPETSAALQKMLKNSPREGLTDEQIAPYNLKREQFYDVRFKELKRLRQEPIIFFTGCFHYKAIQSNTTRVLFTSSLEKIPKEFVNPSIRILELFPNTTCSDLNRFLFKLKFVVSHYDKKNLDYMKYFQSDNNIPIFELASDHLHNTINK